MTPEQDRALKRRSRELGVSEAELVRRALDATLAGALQTPALESPAATALGALLANTRRLAEGRQLDGPFDRDSLYERGAGSQSASEQGGTAS